MGQFEKAAWLTAGQKIDRNLSLWAHLKLTEQIANVKKEKKKMQWDGALLIQDRPVKLLCGSVGIYCTCLLEQSWTAGNVVAESSFQSGEEREETWVINNMSSVLLLQWSVAFHTWSSQGFPCKFLDHCWREETAFYTNSKLFVTSPWIGNWKGNFSVGGDCISNGKTCW